MRSPRATAFAGTLGVALLALLSADAGSGAAQRRPRAAPVPILDGSEALIPEPDRVIAGSFASSLRLGTGFNSLAESLGGECVEDAGSSSTTSGAGSTQISVTYTSSTQTLAQSLHLTAAAHYGSGLWSADGSASFFQSSQSTRDSQYIVINIHRELSREQFGSPRLSAEARALARRGDWLGFLRRCGGQYVAEVVRGGDVRIILRLESAREATLHSLSAQIRASYAGTGGGSASHASEINRTSAAFHGELYLIQQGGTAPTTLPLDIDAAIAQAQQFLTSLSATNAGVVSATVRSYSSVSGVPGNARIANYASLRDGVVARITAERDELRARADRAHRLKTHVERSTEQECVAHRAEYRAHLDAVESSASAAHAQMHQTLSTLFLGLATDATGPTVPASTAFDPTVLQGIESCLPLCPGGTRDGLGYCTRCSRASQQISVNPGSPYHQFECGDMYPGARVRAHFVGGIVPDRTGNPVPYNGWGPGFTVYFGSASQAFSASELGMNAHFDQDSSLYASVPVDGAGRLAGHAGLDSCHVRGTSAGGGQSPCFFSLRWEIEEVP